MMRSPDRGRQEFDATLGRYHAAVRAFAVGDTRPVEAMFSRRSDITLANPFGPPHRGLAAVVEAARKAATHYRDGVVEFERVSEYVTEELAYVLEVEHFKARMDGVAERSNVDLRVTSVFCAEEGSWRLVHRHADPITTPRGVDTLIRAP